MEYLRKTYLYIRRIVLDIFFPSICVNCKKITGPNKKLELICKNCFASIRINKAIPKLIASIGNYEDEALKEIVRSLKYTRAKALKSSIGELIHKYIEISDFKRKLGTDNWIIIPIPLHSKKERERGFNQSALIAKELEKIIDFPVVENILIRKNYTHSQARFKNNKERSGNINGAFVINSPKEITTKNAIIVDDVYTSGATTLEAIKTLKRANINKFIIFVLARAR